MSLLSMVDCTVADNRVQARYEFDKAERDISPLPRSAWFTKWGRALLDAGNASDEDADTIDSLSTELNDAEKHADSLQTAIDNAITALDKIEASEQIRDAIDKIICHLENAG